jgi:hypothetical protein
MTDTDLATTRDALHALAEHVLAAARYRDAGRIGLEVVPGGFATPPFGEDERTVGIENGELVVRQLGDERRAPITTLRAAGEVVGIEPGAPASVYPPATLGELDAPLVVDEQWARRLSRWYALGDAALRRLVAEIPEDQPSGITLWPEHLDVAIRAADVNYGASPGDVAIAEPYVYVGPDVRPAADGFWNHPFGAARTWTEIDSVDEALRFFKEGRAALGKG